MLREAFAAEALSFETMAAYATPRRLAVHVTGLPLAQADVQEELKGPRTDAPEQALAGFLKKTGLTKEQLDIRDDGKKGQVYFANLSRQGRETAAVIAELVPGVVRKFPWPKSMRWGGASLSMDSLRWVRPLQSIICLLNNKVVPFEIDGIKSGNVTRGHRFMSMSQFTVDSFDDYKTKLRMSKVILDPAERMKKIDEQARALAAGVGLTLVEDARLLAENAGLTEWPVVLMGEFDASYLDVPAECLTATMRANQKYFSLRDADGKLANRFLCTANLEAKDGGKMIVAGNQKVLSARLSDAKFFWDQDRKKKLEEYLPKLGDIVFHEKLGTVADKVARVEKLAEHLARTLHPQFYGVTPAQAAPSLVTPAQAGVHASTGAPLAGMDTGLRRYDDVESFVKDVRRAAKLCKADLVTGMVGEFPELQGIMGRYYATAQGENADVAAAIEEHYKPQGQNDTVPTNPVSVCVALADKVDTLASFYWAQELPTGSKDPYGLRRIALGLVNIVIKNSIKIELALCFYSVFDHIYGKLAAKEISTRIQIAEDALKNLGETPTDFRRHQISAFKNAIEDPVLLSRLNEVMGKISWQAMLFIFDRAKVQLRESGVRHDVLDSIISNIYTRFIKGDDNLVRLLARVKALQAFLETDDGTNLMAGYKRAANILKIEEKKDGVTFVLDTTESYTDATEKNLSALFAGGLDDQIANLIEAEDFEAAMAKLATLRAPVYAFLDNVMINDPDPAVRVRRLKLLAGVRDVMHKVADFSKIEG